MHIHPSQSDQQLRKFRRLLSLVLKTNQFYKKKFGACGITSGGDIKTWKDYGKLPFTTKQELLDDQMAHPPYGTNLTYPVSAYTYITSTSGTASGKRFYTAYTNQGLQQAIDQEYLWLQLMHVTKKDRVMYALPYALYPLVTTATMQLGAKVVPADGKTASDLLKNIQALKPTVFETSPSSIFQLIDAAKEFNIPIASFGVKKILLTGETGATIPSIRKKVETAWHADCYDALGSTELGIFSFECEHKSGPHLIEKNTIFEILDPISHTPAKEGELIGTALWRSDFPIIRYKTGDYVRPSTKMCSCGWKSPVLTEGIIGKVDGSMNIRDTAFFPSEIERVIRTYPEVEDFAATVIRRKGIDEFLLTIEVSVLAKRNVRMMLEESLKEHMGFKPHIAVVPPKTLDRQSWKTVRIVDKRSADRLSDSSIHQKYKYNFVYDTILKIRTLIWSSKIKKG